MSKLLMGDQPSVRFGLNDSGWMQVVFDVGFVDIDVDPAGGQSEYIDEDGASIPIAALGRPDRSCS